MLLRRTSTALPDEVLELFADHLRTKKLLTQQALQIRELTRVNSERQESQAREQQSREELERALAASEAERESLRRHFAEMARDSALPIRWSGSSIVGIAFEERQQQAWRRSSWSLRPFANNSRLAEAASEQTSRHLTKLRARLAALGQKGAAGDDAIARLATGQERLQGQFGYGVGSYGTYPRPPLTGCKPGWATSARD